MPIILITRCLRNTIDECGVQISFGKIIYAFYNKVLRKCTVHKSTIDQCIQELSSPKRITSMKLYYKHKIKAFYSKIFLFINKCFHIIVELSLMSQIKIQIKSIRLKAFQFSNASFSHRKNSTMRTHEERQRGGRSLAHQ